MEFSNKEITLIKDILNHYISSREYMYDEERKKGQLIANKGKDPILQDLFLDNLKSNVFYSNGLLENLPKITKENPRTKNKSFNSIMSTIDGPLVPEDNLLYVENWFEACDSYCKYLSKKQSILNKTITDTKMVGINNQKREILIGISECLFDVTTIGEKVKSFMISNDVVLKPKKPFNIK